MTIREGRSFCINCERPHTKRALIQGAPQFVSTKQPQGKGIPTRCVERATPSNAVEAVDECIAKGGSEEDAKWKLRQTMSGAYTPKADYIEGMQLGLNRIEQKLDSRDNPGGVTIRKIKAEKKPGG